MTSITTSTASPKLLKGAVFLAWATIFYNLIEGFVSVGFGVAEESVALFGFGLDSFIEVGSALLVLWRFSAEAKGGITRIDREMFASRSIGRLFVLLAVIIALTGVHQLTHFSHPETTLPGTIIALLSIMTMIYLWKAKRRLAEQLNSPSLKNDAACTMACIKLSVVLLVGSFIYLIAPQLWWVDAMGALILSYFTLQEGRGMLKTDGDGCGACCQ